MTRTITAIPATKTAGHSHAETGKPVRRRVAAYARVSTDMEEQASSYEAQISYYTTHIHSRTDWVFAGMYADEGISGTSTKHREGFQHMITDALAGKIDLILTKSVSRFARNTVDSLTTVRRLKDAGVEVYFEKENIYTFDSKGELLITIMSSLAQEESRSISENVTWGHRKRFAEGKIMVPYKSLLGYKKGEGGTLVIDETQAPIVRRIYANYLDGMSPKRIAQVLTVEQIPTPRGKHTWTTTTIRSILTNEKYKGDALLQKTFTADFLTKKMKVNEGEIPQYYVTGNHEPIIDPAVWDVVQTELARRSGHGTSSGHPFASAIKCGQCGGWYGRKTWHAGTKYERHIWRCNNKYEGNKTRCTTPCVTELQIQQAFIDALASRLGDKRPVDQMLSLLDTTMFNTTALEARQAALAQQIEETIALMNQLITNAATSALNPDDYDCRYKTLEQRHQDLASQRDQAEAAIIDLKRRQTQAHHVATYLTTRPPLEYSNHAWNTLVDHAEVSKCGEISVVFKDSATLQYPSSTSEQPHS